MRTATRWPGDRAMMTLGDRAVALAAIAFINASFAVLVPWLAAFTLLASLPLLAAVLFR